MALSQRARRNLRLIRNHAVVAMTIGGAFGFLLTSYSLIGLVDGIAIGFLTATSLACFELFLMGGPAGRALRRLPFAGLLALRVAVYGTVAMGAYAAGRLLVSGPANLFVADAPFFWSIAFSLAFSVAANFFMLVRRLAGPGVIAHFVLGRYNRPRPERRSLLFLDVVGSTAIAERIGAARFHALLNSVMYDIAGPVTEYGGELHKYVGDEAIITWTASGDVVDPRPAACVAAIVDRLDRRASEYEKTYGNAVRLRAGLHVGDVVTGEMGDQRQEIAMVGDGVNTAARLVDAARDTGHQVIATTVAIDPQHLPKGWQSRPLGPVALRGKAEPLELAALERAA
ncbi:MAG: adenylate/guanylate cyclase domain-containing protein [Alphaproteobacteria bacterium]|nr:adenylate/guanylate cyclase domain-containing protein [Alphaproteobacteria bacterium]